ncbi:hypothetical protein ACI2K4_22215 [Micromonospora sp. NPDC050397]|uniref:hypothetical protein n=1 Tax=Micromonospora sp. NPDC050397 TaxID=3364279 RepID=UPI00384FAA8B
MGELTLHDTAPRFHVERNDTGDVELMVCADGTAVRINIGRDHDDASSLAERLRDLSENTATDILADWWDIPDESDAYISFDRDRYHVTLEGSIVGTFPSRDVAEIELARAMVTHQVFPRAWYINDRGNYSDIDADVRRWHDEGGDQMVPLPGVEYQPGDLVWHGDPDWPYKVVDDWGEAGVEIHTVGDPTVRAHVTDRTQLRPYSL